MLLDEIGQYLDAQDVITYDPTGLSGNFFMDTLPNNPDVAVMIRDTPGTETELIDDYIRQGLQFIIRGDKDPRIARELAYDIYNELHGFEGELVDGGTYIVDMTATDTPFQLTSASDGTTDNSGRYKYSINFMLEIKR